MTNILIIIILLTIIASIILYLCKAKRRGEYCVGCPYAKHCSKNFCSENSLKN